jgi:AcrR family transcriptional regulator
LSGGDTRESIIDAIERLLARLPLRKITMDDIATEAGLGRRTLYVYFPNRDEIMYASIDRVVCGVLDGLAHIAEDSSKTADRRLREMLVARIALRLRAVRSYAANLNSVFTELRAEYLERRKAYVARETAIFASVVRAGRAAGIFSAGKDAPDDLAVARTLLQATNSLLLYSLTAEEIEEAKDVTARAAAIADLLMDGLCAREQGG